MDTVSSSLSSFRHYSARVGGWHPHALSGLGEEPRGAVTGNRWAAKAARGSHTRRRVRGSVEAARPRGGASAAPQPAPSPFVQLPALPGFADVVALPHEPELGFLPAGTWTWPARSCSQRTRSPRRPPFSATPRPRPPPSGGRHVTPPPALPAPPLGPTSHPQGVADVMTQRALAYSVGDAEVLLVCRWR